MASMKEIALGVTGVLQHSQTPEPLAIDLVGESTGDAAMLVTFVLAECHDAQLLVTLVRVPDEVWAIIGPSADTLVRPAAAKILPDSGLQNRLEFWRRPPPQEGNVS